MKKQILMLGFLGLLGCMDKEKPKPPAGLLAPEKLTAILADIHIVEAQVESVRLGADTARVIFEQKQTEILKKRGVSRQIFDKTYDYYLKKDLTGLDKIYEALVDTLSLREVKYGSKPEDATRPPSTDPMLH